MEQAAAPRNQIGELVTAKEVARLLRVSLRTVWRMRSGGCLPEEIRMGRGIRWRKEELADWIAKGCPSRNRAQEESHLT